MKMGFINSTFLLSLLVQTLLVCVAFADVHHYEFVLENMDVVRMGQSTKIMVVNGQYPGPEIRAHRGDTVMVNVINNADRGVTIHWHGVKQPRNPWSDGPEFVTQCPIEPGTSFLYEVILSDEEGTLWWHAHSDWTRTSVYGSLVVLPIDGIYPAHMAHDAEHTLILGSWYKDEINKMVDGMITGCAPPIADAFTINGQPGDYYPDSSDDTHVVNVVRGRTYLLRIVNGVLNENNFFAIADHNLMVVGIDGVYLKPFVTPYIMITPGQTMDVLFKADQISLFRYYIAANAYADYGQPSFVESTTTAILQYDGPGTSFDPMPATLPEHGDTTAATEFTLKLKHFHPDVTVPTAITTSLFMTIALNSLPCVNCCPTAPGGNTRRAGSISNISFVLPNPDILTAYSQGISGVYTEDFPLAPAPFDYTNPPPGTHDRTITGTKVRVLEYGEEVEIIFQITGIAAPMNHPMHLHGQNFFLVGLGFGNYNDATDRPRFNITGAPEMNTVAVPKNGWAAIRFFANNPGVWFMHCHFERHASYGMEMAFIVKDGPTEATSMLPPPSYMPHCAGHDAPAPAPGPSNADAPSSYGFIADRTRSPYGSRRSW